MSNIFCSKCKRDPALYKVATGFSKTRNPDGTDEIVCHHCYRKDRFGVGMFKNTKELNLSNDCVGIDNCAVCYITIYSESWMTKMKNIFISAGKFDTQKIQWYSDMPRIHTMRSIYGFSTNYCNSCETYACELLGIKARELKAKPIKIFGNLPDDMQREIISFVGEKPRKYLLFAEIIQPFVRKFERLLMKFKRTDLVAVAERLKRDNVCKNQKIDRVWCKGAIQSFIREGMELEQMRLEVFRSTAIQELNLSYFTGEDADEEESESVFDKVMETIYHIKIALGK